MGLGLGLGLGLGVGFEPAALRLVLDVHVLYPHAPRVDLVKGV